MTDEDTMELVLEICDEYMEVFVLPKLDGENREENDVEEKEEVDGEDQQEVDGEGAKEVGGEEEAGDSSLADNFDIEHPTIMNECEDAMSNDEIGNDIL